MANPLDDAVARRGGHGVPPLQREWKHTEAMIKGEVPPPPVARLIGFELISVKPGEVVELQTTTEKHANPMGTVHGGILCDIADAAMGIAYASNLDQWLIYFTHVEFPLAE